MAQLNDIVFQLGQGRLGRALPGSDYISGLLFFAFEEVPLPFKDKPVRTLYSESDALALGIHNDYRDAVEAVAKYKVTAMGANGNSVTITVKEPDSIRTLVTYVKTAAESSVTAVAAAIAAAINAGKNEHGYRASVNTDTVSIVAPKKFGVFLNSRTPLNTIYSPGATLAGTVNQFDGGVASEQAVWYYHISEFFRMAPSATLNVGLYPIPSTYNYSEVEDMQGATDGTMRQVGVLKPSAFAANGGDLMALSNACLSCINRHQELIGFIGADMADVDDLSSLSDLSQLNAPWASAVISQDGAAKGAFLYETTGKSVTNLGAVLGAVAAAKVSNSIAWVEKFNISNGVECDVLAFANGQLYNSFPAASLPGLLGALQDKRYIFLRKFTGIAGSYVNEESTSVAVSSDYAYISNTRTIQKAMRGIRASLLPALNSPLVLNEDGTLQATTLEYLGTLVSVNLDQMQRDAELSAYDKYIAPNQNVAATGKLYVDVSLLPVGVARNIIIRIGFTTTIA